MKKKRVKRQKKKRKNMRRRQRKRENKPIVSVKHKKLAEIPTGSGLQKVLPLYCIYITKLKTIIQLKILPIEILAFTM